VRSLLSSWSLAAFGVTAFAVAACSTPATEQTTSALPPSQAAGSSGTLAPGTRCVARDGLPDPRCTPGQADPRVTPANVRSTICRRGYSASVRPPQQVTYRIKVRTTRAYGVTVPFSQVELDHLVPLSLGGTSTDANLWPELRSGPRGAATKDDVEVRLHDAVCSGRLGLRAAQRAIASDWTTAR